MTWVSVSSLDDFRPSLIKSRKQEPGPLSVHNFYMTCSFNNYYYAIIYVSMCHMPRGPL